MAGHRVMVSSCSFCSDPAAGATALAPPGRADNAKSDIYRQSVKMLNGSENQQKIQQIGIFSEIKDNAHRSVY